MKSETDLPVQMSPMMTVAVPEEVEGGLNFAALLRTLRRKWWVIAAVTTAGAIAAGAKVLTETPLYGGQFEILVQAQSTETEVIADVPNTLTARAEQPVDGDLLKLLTSPKVLQPVIDGVRERDPNFCPPATLPSGAPGLEGGGELSLENSAANSAGNVASSSVATNYDPCYYQLSERLRLGVIDQDSEIIRVTFQSLNPQTVQIVLDLVSQAYLDYSLESKQADISRGLEFVEQKLPDLRQKVDALAEQLQLLRLENNLIDPAARGNQLAGQLGAFSQQQLEIQAQLQQARATYNNLTAQLSQSGTGAASTALDQNPRYQTLLNSLLELDAQIAEASTIYLAASPDMQILQEERDNLLVLLAEQGQQSQQAVISQIQDLQARERALQQTLQGINNNVADLSGISRSYADIERELQISTENLNRFLAKREALQIDSAQREVPWEIITPPTFPSPQPEKLPQNLILGAMLGLLLGSGLALLLDKSTGVIYGDEDIRRVTRLPILARVPVHEVFEGGSSVHTATFSEASQYVGNGSNGGVAQLGVKEPHLKPISYGSDPFAEAFRLLFTNLQSLNSGYPVRSVTISSAMPGEGKSTVAIYLAEAAAAMGQRVLLVDADLRSPRIHQYLELENKKGLTDIFSGEVNPEVIQKLEIAPNMYVLCAGSIALEPTRLLASKGMQQLMEKVKPLFDLIIFDTPPLLGQSDAYLVANHTDGLLLVTQSGKLKQPLLDRAMEQLSVADVNVLGIVSREE